MAEKKHYIEYYSPGTIVCEQSRRGPVDSWNTALACELANGVLERHNAKPFGFRFITQLEADPISDGQGGTMKVEPKETARSAMHYLGGKVMRYEDIPDDDKHTILRSNMRCNGWPLVIQNENSWRFTGQFNQADLIVDADGSVIRRGVDPDLVRYSEQKLAEWKADREARA